MCNAKNHFDFPLSAVAKGYDTYLMGGEMTPYLVEGYADNRIQGMYVGLHPIEQLAATPERRAQIQTLLTPSIRAMLTPEGDMIDPYSNVAFHIEKRTLELVEQLGTALEALSSGVTDEMQKNYQNSDNAMKQVLEQEIIPALHPELLEVIPSTEVPIDGWLLPTLEAMFVHLLEQAE
jgi:hypothetical protein